MIPDEKQNREKLSIFKGFSALDITADYASGPTPKRKAVGSNPVGDGNFKRKSAKNVSDDTKTGSAFFIF